MNATKRKFSALLNGIGNKSTTSLSKEADDVSTDLTDLDDNDMWKRRRIAPASTLVAVGNARNITAKIKISHRTSASHGTDSPTIAEPKYAPWDRAAFLKRLKSFSNLTDWTPKPARVNEVEWAKRGWVCQKMERVRCSLCNVEILVKLNKKEVEGKEEPVYVAANIEEALVDTYAELIVTSHSEDCLWRKRGCDDTIFKLPLNNATDLLSSLRQRYDELCLRKDTLPYAFNLRLPDSFSVETILTYFPADFFPKRTDIDSANAPDPQTPDVDKVALTLALFGWQGNTHPRLGVQLGSISCAACFRNLGLWLFKSKAVNAEGVETKAAVVNCLQPVSEHRSYCPWRSAVSQNGKGKISTSSLAGWEIAMKMLKNEYYLRTGGVDVIEARPVTQGNIGSAESDVLGLGEVGEVEVETKDEREAKDKERWARLRRVKSLFDTKSTKKLQRADGLVSLVGKGK